MDDWLSCESEVNHTASENWLFLIQHVILFSLSPIPIHCSEIVFLLMIEGFLPELQCYNELVINAKIGI